MAPSESVDPEVRLSRVDRAIHGPLLRQWLARPDVVRWWGDPQSCWDLIAATPDDRHGVIDADGTPIGYVRWEPVDRAMLDSVGLHRIPDGAIDIDLFIGEPAWRGRGVAVRLLRLLIDRLAADTHAPAAGLCTSVENRAAIRAFTKAGFTKTTKFDDPEYGPCWAFLAELHRE